MKNNYYIHRKNFSTLCPYCSQVFKEGHICIFHGEFKIIDEKPIVEHKEFFRVVKNAQGIPIDTEYFIHQYPLKTLEGFSSQPGAKVRYTLREENGNIVAILLK